ncbi:hypothetical protein L1987_58965 [Smallanthus sonchifolius]|uniref:Uncharacterized protein n=1 Tax=Smallanthus sonchifolius TaxID=185202 RepID=A0ACB9D3V0_9ASTR|nr:hypothetical protein L1987_58965 [Smallanthus sonchifolius]
MEHQARRPWSTLVEDYRENLHGVEKEVGGIVPSNTRTYTRRATLNRDREAAHERLIKDYFCDEPIYNAETFRNRFRIRRNLFLRIVNDLEREMDYFKLKWDARGRRGFTPIQKCTTAMRQLAYGSGSDELDENIKIAKKTTRICLYKFCKCIINIYGPKYLRKPTSSDIQKIYKHHEEVHGLLGMLGSLYCMHWEWSNCPNAWRGQYMRGDHPAPTIMLEAVTSQDLWFWHAFFGVAGSNNDINLLNQSPLFNTLVNGTAPDSSFDLRDEPRKYFKRRQESARKDIERAFGVIKQRFQIVKNPARAWKLERIRRVMYTCIILHNMIIEDDGRAICEFNEEEFEATLGLEEVSEAQQSVNEQYKRNREIHNNLRQDLVLHLDSGND